jgi:predicted kinase
MQSDTGESTAPTVTKTELESFQPSHPTGTISKQQMAQPNKMNFSTTLRNNSNPFATSNYTTQRRRITDTNNNQSDNFERICALIKQNVKVLVLMRGLPGSGKSTMARNLMKATMDTDGVNPTNHILSADDYFVDRYGRYVYAREKIGEAHEFTQNRTLKRMQEGWSPIIVDNTAMKVWEMIPYIKMSVTYGYVIKILEPNTPWARKPHILAKKNSHEVPEITIRRMLESYEPASLKEILKSLQMEYHLQVKPSLRTNPAPRVEEAAPRVEPMEVTEAAAIVQVEQRDIFSFGQSVPIGWTENQDNGLTKQCSLSSIPLPKPPRFAHLTPAMLPNTDNDHRTTTRTNTTVDWQPHESKPTAAWTAPVQAPVEKAETPQPRRDPPKVSQNNDLLDLEDVRPTLAKHRTGCSNENASFVMLRTIYPTLPVIYLWDLFVNCNGDIEWTMDILLKDKSTMDFLGDESQPVHGSVDYEISCDCGKGGGEQPACRATVQPVETRTQSPAMKQVRREKVQPSVVDKQALRAIEQNFVIGDEHYSDKLKKYRNFRHGPPPQKVPPSAPATASKSPATSEEEEEAEEIVEIELGLGLVTRLEGLFGAELTEQNVDALRLKTNVFMTKSLANQLYALWRESLYNQLEEQRIKSLKEDEEFARQLHAQEKYPLLYQLEEPKNLKDRMEMEAALESYREEVKRGWQDSLSNDMAAQMSREKLFKLFPNVDRETLVEILAAHEGRFEETIESLGHSLNGQDLREKLHVTTKDLFEAARKESILVG